MVWTTDQYTAIQDIEQWRIDNRPGSPKATDENRFYVLEGAAGTGKTTVVQELIRLFHGYKLCVAAPTHTAKEVIAEMTGKKGLTVHNLLGLRPDLDLKTYDPANPSYSTQSKEQIADYDIVFIDEGSMVNKALNKKIKEKAVHYRVLVLFIGDSYQLPPVNERLSEVFLYKNKSLLREVVRQQNSNPNQQLLLDARTDIETKSSFIDAKFSAPYNEVNTFNDMHKPQGLIITADKEVFYSKLIELYSDSEAKTNNKFVKTLAFTNTAVEKLNKFIKARINPSESLICENDHLLGYKSVMKGTTLLIQNGTSYYIHHLEIIEIKVSMRLYKFYRVMINTEGKTIDILHPDSYIQFHQTLEHLYERACDNNAWRPFFKFKEQFIVMTAFIHSNRLDRKDNPAVMCQKDIDLGYAQTVHKSQGSTYDNVAIMYENFNVCRDIDDKRRLRYVALSRTRYLNLAFINPK